MNRKKIILLGLLLLGVLLVFYSEPFGHNWESTARIHTLSKLARMLHSCKERFHEDPASWAELCRRLPEYSLAEKQSLLWPRWASKYCGPCPREWNPDNPEDSRMSVYELMPAEDAGLLVVEKTVVASWRYPRLGIGKEDYEPYVVSGSEKRRLLPFSEHRK